MALNSDDRPDANEDEVASGSTATEESPLLVRSTSKTSVQGGTPVTILPADGGKAANLVLLACCLAQFPVWGFVTGYGVLEKFYQQHPDEFYGDTTRTGIIATTLNGIIYVSMPVLFGLFGPRYYSAYRKHAAFAGILLLVLSLVLSSATRVVWQVIMTQGVLQGIGSTVVYSSTMIYLDEWWIKKKGYAFGVTLAAKSLFGVVSPFIFEGLLIGVGFRRTLWIFAATSVACTLPAIWMLKPRHIRAADRYGHKKFSWSFLRLRGFYIFQLANLVFSLGYGLPQTHLTPFAADILGLSGSQSALMLTAFNAPNIVASFWFGLLSDGGGLWRKEQSLSIETISALSALGAGISAFLFWGLVPITGEGGTALLILYAIFYGFFAGGYSATWGGVVKEMESEADARDEDVDTGLQFGLLNGVRGVGFLTGGLIGVELLKEGGIGGDGGKGKWGYESPYGSMIVFIGVTAAVSGVAILFRKTKALGPDPAGH